MADRDTILEKNFPTPEGHPDICMITNAMDEYMKESCLELLEYVGKKVKWAVESDGKVLFWNGSDYLTKEQLFENFL